MDWQKHKNEIIKTIFIILAIIILAVILTKTVGSGETLLEYEMKQQTCEE